MPPKKAVTSSKKTAPAKGARTGEKAATKQSANANPSAPAVSQKPAAQRIPELQIAVKEIANVLLNDTEGKVKGSGRWPIVIDPQGVSATFLKYREANCLNAMEPNDVNPMTIRRVLLGALRYGKIFVYDMMTLDATSTLQSLSERLDEIVPGLFNMIMDKTITQEENYSKLIRPEDGDDYALTKFSPMMTDEFKFVLITRNPDLADDFKLTMYPIRIE